jgi:hypothetical protein
MRRIWEPPRPGTTNWDKPIANGILLSLRLGIAVACMTVVNTLAIIWLVIR